jgi:Rrf2 family transcriptional regulator, iron-sulfur cluster assembly transcription factor
MNLSTASHHAVRAVVHLAAHIDRGLAPSHVIAQAEGISELYLLKILNRLMRAQILIVVKGPNGGYRLARPANKITLLEVLEAVNGPIRGVAGLTRGQGDANIQAQVQALCERVAGQTRRVLGRVTVEDLMDKRGWP